MQSQISSRLKHLLERVLICSRLVNGRDNFLYFMTASHSVFSEVAIAGQELSSVSVNLASALSRQPYAHCPTGVDTEFNVNKWAKIPRKYPS
jgi:hypothetical protein